MPWQESPVHKLVDHTRPHIVDFGSVGIGGVQILSVDFGYVGVGGVNILSDIFCVFLKACPL